MSSLRPSSSRRRPQDVWDCPVSPVSTAYRWLAEAQVSEGFMLLTRQVRYRPGTWSEAIRRRSYNNRWPLSEIGATDPTAANCNMQKVIHEHFHYMGVSIEPLSLDCFVSSPKMGVCFCTVTFSVLGPCGTLLLLITSYSARAIQMDSLDNCN